MMLYFKILLLLVFSFSVQAEVENPPRTRKPDTDNIQVYTKQSSEAVEALNHATEVLHDPVKAFSSSDADKKAPPVANSGSLGGLPRDPTQMSGNFRQSLKNMNPTSSITAGSATSPTNQGIPVVELAARIMGKKKSVLLRIKGHTAQVFEGGQVSLIEDGKISLVDNQSIVSFRVDKIDKNQVEISVLPYNAHLILR